MQNTTTQSITVELLGERHSRTHAALVREIILEGLRLVAGDLLEVVRVRRLLLINARGLHALKLGRIADKPIGQAAARHVLAVLVVAELNVLNRGTVVLREKLAHRGITDRSRSSKVVDLVAVRSLVEDANHGTVEME